VFLVHPQNSLNTLILNWCAGGCWFTPDGFANDVTHHPPMHHLGIPYESVLDEHN
jgi:hypothetical protein